MLKLHIRQAGEWRPVFCYQAGKVLTCESAPEKALPTRAMWGQSDLEYFSKRFATQEFCLMESERNSVRKIDYQTLAQEIKSGHAFALVQLESEGCSAETQTYYRGRMDALRVLAYDLSGRLNVDAAEFIKACGCNKAI